MKTREELEQIARELFSKQTSFDGDYADIRTIVALLARVQDEALNSVLPSESEIEAAAKGHVPDVWTWEAREAAFQCGAKWLRANMKPAPKAERLSDEALLATCKEIFPCEYVKGDASDIRHCSWAYERGYRAAETRLLEGKE